MRREYALACPAGWSGARRGMTFAQCTEAGVLILPAQLLGSNNMSWFSDAARATSASRGSQRTLLAVEQLETRELLSAATVAVTSGVVLSTEGLTDFVTTEYNALLHRPPDAAGLHAFVAQLENGGPPEAVEAEIVASNEYFRNHGSNNTQWVTGLYNDLLGR